MATAVVDTNVPVTPSTDTPVAPPVDTRVPHSIVCTGDTRCDRCHRLGCSGCVHVTGDNLGLCAVCSGTIKETEVILHPVPSSAEIATLPKLVMPPAKYHRNQKVLLIDEREVYTTFSTMAKHLQATNHVSGASIKRLTIGKILNFDLNIDRPRKGYVYLVETTEYPVKQILIGELGLDGSKEAIDFKPLCIGQAVRVREKFAKPKWYDPGESSGMSQNRGLVFYIGQKLTAQRSYRLLDDGCNGTYAHEWLEPISPILRKDKPRVSKAFHIKSPMKRLYYLPWIKLQYRRGDSSSRDKTIPNFPRQYISGDKDLKEVKIHEELFIELAAVHREFITYWGYDTGGSSTSQARPLAFILGERDGIVVTALPCFAGFSNPGGCGQMVTIGSDEFSNLCAEIVKLKCTPCGVARLGCFGVTIRDGRGDSLHELRKFKDFYILSMGRDGMRVETLNADSNLRIHSYRVDKFPKIKKGGITDEAVAVKSPTIESSS